MTKKYFSYYQVLKPQYTGTSYSSDLLANYLFNGIVITASICYIIIIKIEFKK